MSGTPVYQDPAPPGRSTGPPRVDSPGGKTEEGLRLIDALQLIGNGHRRPGILLASTLLALLVAVPARASGPTVPTDGDPAYGEYLSAQCVTCHRAPATAHDGNIPPIVGLPSPAFVEALLAYRNGQRDNQVMRNVTSTLGDEEIAALAAYFASLSSD